MILQKEFHVIYALAHVCGQDRTLLASLLLRIFRHEKAEAPLLRTLNDREINMEGETVVAGGETTPSCFLFPARTFRNKAGKTLSYLSSFLNAVDRQMEEIRDPCEEIQL